MAEVAEVQGTEVGLSAKEEKVQSAMIWHVAAYVTGFCGFACLVLALVFNPTPVPMERDVPWLIAFVVLMTLSPFLFARGDRSDFPRRR